MSVIISFVAALKGGDIIARLIAAGLVLAGLFAFALVMVARHDAVVTERAVSKIERANAESDKAADVRENAAKNCPLDKTWNRGTQTCEP